MVKSKLPTAVIDNTLLSRLTRLEKIIESLPYIFARILIPVEVKEEAFKGPNKNRLRNLLNHKPDFFLICKHDDFLVKELLKELLDVGEASVIAQAEYTRSAVIIDERKGREEAKNREIQVFSTTKILCLMKELGLIDEVRPILDQLIKMRFYLKKVDYLTVLKEVREID